MRKRLRSDAQAGGVGRTLVALGLLALCGLAAPSAVRADPPGGSSEAAAEIAAATRLVTVPYFEGIPPEEIAALGDVGVAHLSRMLGDPQQAAHHARILEVLGRRGGPVAYRAVARYGATEPTGEVSSGTYRAQVALRYAMGRLARQEDGALVYLLLRARPDAPGWQSGHLRGERLARLLRRVSASALGLSGRPEAEAVLHGWLREARSGADRNWERSLGGALELHRDSAQQSAP